MKRNRGIIILLGIGSMLQVKAQDFMISQSADNLVELKKVIPDIILDIKYATPNNFTGQIVYSSSRCFALKPVADALVQVQKELKKFNYALKVWDAFRPLDAQKKMWVVFPDPRYVGNPAHGGRHTRGTAVDCTIVDLTTGKELDMGTGFDDFTEKAWPYDKSISQEAQKNRKLFIDIMAKHGFAVVDHEWWHFDYKGWQQQPVLDVRVEKLP